MSTLDTKEVYGQEDDALSASMVTDAVGKEGVTTLVSPLWHQVKDRAQILNQALRVNV